MKIAAQADYFVHAFGVEAAFRRLKKTGYQNIVYQFNERYDEPFTTTWSDDDLKDYFRPINETAKSLQMDISFTVLGTAIYNDLSPDSTTDRLKMAIHALKATAYMGCNVMAIRPVFFYRMNDFELSKKLSYDLLGKIKKEADSMGIQLAFTNNANCYAYGSTAVQLRELAENLDGKIVIDPSIAYYAGTRIDELLTECGDRVIGFLVTDTKQRLEESTIPTQGSINYASIKTELEKSNRDMYVAMMYSPILRRYSDFLSNDGMVNAVEKFLFKMGNVLIGKEETR